MKIDVERVAILFLIQDFYLSSTTYGKQRNVYVVIGVNECRCLERIERFDP